MRPSFPVDLVRETAERALPRAEAVAADVRARCGDSPTLQRTLPRVWKQAHRTLELLAG